MKKNIELTEFEKRINRNHSHMHFFNNIYNVKHTHITWEIIIMVNGKLNHIVNNKKQIISSQDIYLIKPGDTHYFENFNNEECLHLSISLEDQTARECMDFLEQGMYTQLFSYTGIINYKLDNTTFEYIIDIAKKNTENFPDNIPSFIRQTKFIAMFLINYLYEHINDKTIIPNWLSQFIIKLQNLENYDIPIATLANYTNFSYTHLRRLFKKYMNITIVEYFTKIKLNRAQKLLLTSDKKIITISYELGYYSISHFNKLFKNHIGISPSAFKKTYKIS